jgi:hypothetical protein
MMNWKSYSSKKKIFLKLFVCTLLMAPTAASATINTTPWYHILQLIGGWNDPNLQILTDGAFSNPEGCPVTGTYFVPATLPGRELLESMAVSAFMGGKEVSFIIDGCENNFPKVIAIKIR